LNSHIPNGISRQGLDASFAAEETRKSNLLLQATLLREQGREEAVTRFAEAAEIEEQLSRACLERGLKEKFLVHRFSAASCWAQAGNFYQAITICEQLLAETDLTERLRHRVSSYVNTLRARRNQWFAEAVAAQNAAEV